MENVRPMSENSFRIASTIFGLILWICSHTPTNRALVRKTNLLGHGMMLQVIWVTESQE